MSLDRERLLGVANAERQRLGRSIQFAEPETWEQPSACEGWWNRDVLAHLASADTAAAQLVAGEPATEFDEFRAGSDADASLDLDALNAWTVARRSGLGVRDIISGWGEAADSFLAHAALVSDDDWSSKRYPWVSGDISLRYLIQTRVSEWWLHGEDMRAGNGLGPQYQHWPIHLTIDLAVRMLPWALKQDGFDYSDVSLLVDVEGAGEGEWHWGLGVGTPPKDEKPDALIGGRAPQLGLVAGRRLDVDEVLDSGVIVIGGDRELAETALRSLRAFP